MVTNILLISALCALAYGLTVPLKDDYVINAARNGKNRLSGWNILRPNNTKCNMVRRHIKTFGYCWQDENEQLGINTQKERGWVREVIQQWEKCGGIKFVEEPKCRSGEDFVRIIVGSYHPKVVPYLDEDSCKINGYKMLLGFFTFGENIESYRRTEKVREAVVKMYALHEFGHFIGFDHEHNRDDRKDPIKCNTIADELVVGPGAIWGNYHITKDYDSESIMNYCRPNVHYKPWLSDKDKRGVWEAYGGGNWQECEAVTKPWTWVKGEGLEDYQLTQLDMELKGISCYDLSGTDYCKTMTRSCDVEVMANYYCRKTCGTCSDGSGPSPVQTTAAPAGCVNRESDANCEGWKSLCNGPGTREWCAKTCNAC